MCGPNILARVYDAIARRGQAQVERPTASVTRAAPVTQAAPAPAPHPIPLTHPLPLPSGQIIDLTHTLTSEFPMWPGDPRFEMRRFSPLSDTTFFANTLVLHEHSGTHIDAPAHASATGVTVEEIPAAALVAPLAVIDIAERASADPDTALTVTDILEWERAHGPLPRGALVAMHSGWSARAADESAFLNLDEEGAMRTPGFAPEAARFLVESREVVAIASDTLSIDCGRSEDFGAHLAALGSGLYAVECLANLTLVPPSGAVVVVGAPKHGGGSGGPARVLAFTPAGR